MRSEKASEKYKAEGEEAMNAYVAEISTLAQLPGPPFWACRGPSNGRISTLRATPLW